MTEQPRGAQEPVLPKDAEDAEDAKDANAKDAKPKKPLYPQLLRLRHVHPNAWQRAVLGEGMALTGVLLAMADVASAWAILVLPVAVAAVVKANDLLAGALRPQPSAAPRSGTG